MHIEYNSLLNNGTWTQNSSNSQKIYMLQAGFQDERNPDESINKYKIRLIAKGFHQQQGFDIHETLYL